MTDKKELGSTVLVVRPYQNDGKLRKPTPAPMRQRPEDAAALTGQRCQGHPAAQGGRSISKRFSTPPASTAEMRAHCAKAAQLLATATGEGPIRRSRSRSSKRHSMRLAVPIAKIIEAGVHEVQDSKATYRPTRGHRKVIEESQRRITHQKMELVQSDCNGPAVATSSRRNQACNDRNFRD